MSSSSSLLSSSSSSHDTSNNTNNNTNTNNEALLYSLLRPIYPSLSSVKLLGDPIVQASAVGYKCQLDYDDDDNNNNQDAHEYHDTRDDELPHSSRGSTAEAAAEAAATTTLPSRVFCKHVDAATLQTTKRDWNDLRRALVYIRTEVRFYQVMTALPQQEQDQKQLHAILPRVYHATYHLDGLLDEDEHAVLPMCTSTTTATTATTSRAILPTVDQCVGKGGLLVLELMDTTHITDTHSTAATTTTATTTTVTTNIDEHPDHQDDDTLYYQTSPLTLAEGKQCLSALAVLHQSCWQSPAWSKRTTSSTTSTTASSSSKCANKDPHKQSLLLSVPSFALPLRNPKELAAIVPSWQHFRTHFGEYFYQYDETRKNKSHSSNNNKNQAAFLLWTRTEGLAARLEQQAHYISQQLLPSYEYAGSTTATTTTSTNSTITTSDLSPCATSNAQQHSSFATLVHGDYKAMNVFLPAKKNRSPYAGAAAAIAACSDDGVGCDGASSSSSSSFHRTAKLVDFASAGIGNPIMDVAMHIAHAVLPHELEAATGLVASNGKNGDNNDNDAPIALATRGEMELVQHYLNALNDSNDNDKQQQQQQHRRVYYPVNAALWHYKLATVDYLRFFMGRMWASATPSTMENKRNNPNIANINRYPEAAMAFIDRAEGYLSEIEEWRRNDEAMNSKRN